MMINLNENFRLTSDEYCFIVQQRKISTKRDTGEQYENWVDKWFFPTLEQAVNKLVDYEVRVSDAEGVDKVLKAIESSKKAIVKELKKGVK